MIPLVATVSETNALSVLKNMYLKQARAFQIYKKKFEIFGRNPPFMF